jgi:hypothetical protein
MLAAAILAGCSSGPGGLGRKACPYLRPRLVRLDRDVAQGSTADLAAVGQDVALYVSALPDGGHATADQPLVRFSAALSRRDLVALGPDEAAVKHECGVT